MPQAIEKNEQSLSHKESVVLFRAKVAHAKRAGNETETAVQNPEVARLVRQAKAGTRTAFDRLVERFEARVFRIVVSRLGNAADAHEVTQEVFLTAYTKLAQLRKDEFFPRWLSRIAEHRAINRAVRRQYVVCVGSEVLDARVDAGPTPVEMALEQERAGQVWDGLGRLRSMDREALLAFYIHGQSLNEISHQLDVPLGTVKRRLHVARKRLRTELEQLV